MSADHPPNGGGGDRGGGPRRQRAVSFTLFPSQPIGAPANVTQPAATQHTTTHPLPPPPQQQQQQPSIDFIKLLRTTEEQLRDLSTHGRTVEKENAIITSYNTLSTELENAERNYMSSSIRCPLFDKRNDYEVSRLSQSVVVDHSHVVNMALEWFVDPSRITNEPLMDATGRFLAVLAEINPVSSVFDLDQMVDTNSLFLRVIDHQPTTTQQRTEIQLRIRKWCIAVLTFLMNDRRDRMVSDLAVVDILLPDGVTTVRLPDTLIERVVKELIVPPPINKDPLATYTPASELELTLRCLSYIGEYQETLTPVLNMHLDEVLLNLLRDPPDLGVEFACLELCSRLIAHKSFALKFVSSGGLDILMAPQSGRRQEFTQASRAWCLSGIASLTTIMEKVVHIKDMHKRLVDFSLSLLDSQQDVVRKNALHFFASAFAFPIILQAFDDRHGPSKLLDLLYNPVTTQRIISVANLVKHTTATLRQYVRTHLAIIAHMFRTTQVIDQDGRARVAVGKRLNLCKPLPVDATAHHRDLKLLLAKRGVMTRYFSQTRWNAVEELLRVRDSDNSVSYTGNRIGCGIQLLAGIIRRSLTSEETGSSNAAESALAALEILSIVSIVPSVPMVMCERPFKLRNDYFRAQTTFYYTEPSLVAADGTVSQPSQATTTTTTDHDGMSDVTSVRSVNDTMDDDESCLAVVLHAASSAFTSDTGDMASRLPRAIIAATETVYHCVTSGGDGTNQKAIRRCARRGNAIMILTSLLGYKEHPKHADAIKRFACLSLQGLCRDPEVQNILRQQNVDRVVSEIVTSAPVVVSANKDAAEELKKCALELLHVISATERGDQQQQQLSAAILPVTWSQQQQQQLAAGTTMQHGGQHAADAAARKIARSAIVKGSNVQFHQSELLYLIRDHLERLGFTHAAYALKEDMAALPVNGGGDGNLAIMPAASSQWPRKTQLLQSSNNLPTTTTTTTTTTPLHVSIPLRNRSTVHVNPIQTPTRIETPSPIRRRATSMGSTEIPTKRMRINSPSLPPPHTPQRGGGSSSALQLGPSLSNPSMLERLVRDYFRHQHESCPHPSTVPPPFSLFKTHTCPDVQPRYAPDNMSARVFKRQILPPWGGVLGREKFMRSVFLTSRWMRAYSFNEMEEEVPRFVICRAVDGYNDEVWLGHEMTSHIVRFNMWTGQVIGTHLELEYGETPGDHFRYITAMDLVGSTLLTCTHDSITEDGGVETGNDVVSLYSMRDIDDMSAATVSGVGVVVSPTMVVQHLRLPVLASTSAGMMLAGVTGNHNTNDHVALYDVASLQSTIPVRTFISPYSNYNGISNVSLGGPTNNEFVLYDGYLWDARTSRALHKFDRLSSFGYGELHPGGHHVLINRDVWDLRTFRLFSTCSNALEGTRSRFTKSGDFILSWHDPLGEYPPSVPYSSFAFRRSIVVTSASTYDSVAMMDFDSGLMSWSMHPNQDHIAVVINGEDGSSAWNLSPVRMYELGRRRPDDDDSDVDDAQVAYDAIENQNDSEQSSEGSGDDEDDDDDEDAENMAAEFWQDLMNDGGGNGNGHGHGGTVNVGHDTEQEIELGELAEGEDLGDALVRALHAMQAGGGIGQLPLGGNFQVVLDIRDANDDEEEEEEEEEEDDDENDSSDDDEVSSDDDEDL